MIKNIIVYPTSADPPTLGHADILIKIAKKFDLVYWLIANNPDKKPFFKTADRLKMMRLYTDKYKLDNVIIDSHEGAVVRYAKSKGASFILRGLRNSSDFQAEIELSSANRGIDNRIETICLFAEPKFSNISSSLVRQLALLGEDYSPYVIKEVADLISKSLKKP